MGFWGDMLKIMAHSGLQTGSNLLTGALSKTWAQEAELKNYIGQQLYKAAGSASTEDQPAIQAKLKELSGVEVPMSEQLKTITGVGPGGETASLAQGKSSSGSPLSWLATSGRGTPVPGGVTPDMERRLIAPVPSVDQLKAETAASLPFEERRNVLFPKDMTLAAARMNLLEKLAAASSEKEKDRILRSDLAQQHNALVAQIAAATEAGRADQRSFMRTYLTDKLAAMTDAKEQALMQGEIAKLTNLEDKIGVASSEADKKLFRAQANKFIDSSKYLKGYPKWQEDVTVPGTGYEIPIIGGTIGGKKTRVDIGTTPSAPETPEEAKKKLKAMGYNIK